MLLPLLVPSVHQNHFSSIVHQRLAVNKNLAEIEKNVTKYQKIEAIGNKWCVEKESPFGGKKLEPLVSFRGKIYRFLLFVSSSSNILSPTRRPTFARTDDDFGSSLEYTKPISGIRTPQPH